MESRYKLADGAAVREEDFGLLFYTFRGPRLYFLPSGNLLGCGFFQGDASLTQWLENEGREADASAGKILSLKKALSRLKDKGVIIEC